MDVYVALIPALPDDEAVKVAEQLAVPADTDSNSTIPPVAMLFTTAVFAPASFAVTTCAEQLEKLPSKVI